jgi:hypothetical protein
MHDIFSREPDPLDGLLAPPPSADTEALRQEVLARTTAVLRRRRRRRRLAWAGALAALVLAGLLVVGVRMRPPAPPEVVVQPGPPAPPAERPVPPTASALALEWQATDSTTRRAELYREAGDRYLAEEADPQSALRCYAGSLDSAGADLTISPDDNWLLMAIKDARQKENAHAKNGG